MAVNPDFRDLFSAFNDAGAEYLLVGAHAVHTQPRYSKHMDAWVRPTRESAERVFRALARFGAPLEGVTPRDFADPEMIYQLGVAPNRIDVIMAIAGVDFEQAWTGRVETTYGGVPIHVIGKAELIRAKKASGRPQDLLDVEALEKTPDQSPAACATNSASTAARNARASSRAFLALAGETCFATPRPPASQRLKSAL